jgi:hypothetical protein
MTAFPTFVLFVTFVVNQLLAESRNGRLPGRSYNSRSAMNVAKSPTRQL